MNIHMQTQFLNVHPGKAVNLKKYSVKDQQKDYNLPQWRSPSSQGVQGRQKLKKGNVAKNPLATSITMKIFFKNLLIPKLNKF